MQDLDSNLKWAQKLLNIFYWSFGSKKIIRERPHMTSDDFGPFLTYWPTLIRWFTTWAYLVKSDGAWPTYLP